MILNMVYSKISRLLQFGSVIEINPFILSLNIVLINKLCRVRLLFLLLGIIISFVSARALFIFTLILIMSMEKFEFKKDDYPIALFFLFLNVTYIIINAGVFK